jgi:hypothetical protein
MLVDGERRAWIAHGGSISLEVAAGHHAVQATVDWATTPAVELDIAEGETVDFRLSPGPGLAIINVMRPSKYLVLERIEPGEAPT